MELAKHLSSEYGTQDSSSAQRSQTLQLDGLPGIWLNTNRDSHGIVKVVVAVQGPRLLVRAFGAGDPETCDWGEVEANQTYAGSVSSRVAAGFTAWYDFDFSRIHLQANWNQGLLVLASFTSFKDGSRRSNYFSREFFHRELPRQEEN